MENIRNIEYIIIDKEGCVYTPYGWIDPQAEPSAISTHETRGDAEDKLLWAEYYKNDDSTPGSYAREMLAREPRIEEVEITIEFL
ncbi:MAG: hypothetical protein LC687_00205 [Actinobacteria bacterium]|nr:hypothetical protein [Actinomycetota bacterium]MCA1806292.1 hypothetical protein [Actinomycetota bacterium]